jgi:hypothetical protein
MNAAALVTSARTSIRCEPTRSTRYPTGNCAATERVLEIVSAKPRSTKPMPSCDVRKGKSGGRTKFWKWLTKCAKETTASARYSALSWRDPPDPSLQVSAAEAAGLSTGALSSRSRDG